MSEFTDLDLSLKSYHNLEFLTDKTPEGLKKQLQSINLPYKILSIYSVNSSHIAWISLTRPIKKIKKRINK
jgi:hypothetical protein